MTQETCHILFFACREALAAIDELPDDMKAALAERYKGHHALDVARDVLVVAIQRAEDDGA